MNALEQDRFDQALAFLARLPLEHGVLWGAVAAEWQWADARQVLSLDGPPHTAITRPRGGAKTSDLGALLLVVALTQAPDGARLYGVAADRDQGRLLLDSIGGYAQRAPALKDVVDLQAFKVVTHRDVTIEILAADAAGSWGLRPYFLVADELAQWGSTPQPRLLWESLTTALPKVPSSRAVVITSAGSPSHWSRKVFDYAEESPLWVVSETRGPVPWIPSDRLEDERRRLSESSYRRLHLNEWVAAEDALVDPDDLRACVTLDGPQAPVAGRRYVIGLDVGIKHDATCATVVHAEGEKVVLDRIETWTPSKGRPVELQAVEEWLDLASRAYGRAPIIYDPWQAIQLAQRLRSRGLRAVEFSFSSQSISRLAMSLHLLLRERRLALPPDEALLDEIAAVHLRETGPNVYRIDHDPDGHDDRVVSLALAAHHVLEGRGQGGVRVHVRHPETLEPMAGAVALVREKDVSDALNDDRGLGLIDAMARAEERIHARRAREAGRR